MTFWGIEVKPGKPYTHSSKDGSGRLRISQATLAIGTATLKTLVQCNVGDKRPVLLCVLMPNKTESLQLDLEFDEPEDVTFSVIGPRGVYLTGYYVGQNRHSAMQDESESYGEDIANSETMESNHGSDEDEYEDSFINDDEPEPLTPASASGDDEDFLKNRNGNGGLKRLKKRYQLIESDDEISVPEVDDEDDIPISSICKNKKSQAAGKKTKKDKTVELDRETKSIDVECKSDAVNSGDLDTKDKIEADLVNNQTKGEENQPNTPVPSLAEVVPESKSKTKKKKRESSKDKKVTDPKEDKAEANGVKTRKKGKDHTKKRNDVEADDEKLNDTGVGHSIEVLSSAEVVPEKKTRKRRGCSEVNDLLAGNKQEDGHQAIDKSSCVDVADGSQSDEKKAKKKKRKTSKTQEVEENNNMNVNKDNNKPSATEPEGKGKESESCNKKTLSNGLVIEDLKTGKSKGKVAAAGKKVKVTKKL